MGTVTIIPLARRTGLIKKIVVRLKQFEQWNAPTAADEWWCSKVEDFRTRARSWGLSDGEIDRQVTALFHAVRAEHRRQVERERRGAGR